MTDFLSGCKLTYFDMPGRAEPIRLAFAIGNVAFADERIEFARWKEVKPTMPMGSLPVLTLANGVQIPQARAIARLVARSVDLYPSDLTQACLCDSLMDSCDDLGVSVNAEGRGMEQSAKEKARLEGITSGSQFAYLQKIDAFIAKHGSNGYAVGAELTIADLFVFAVLTTVISGFYDGIPPTALDPFPSIQAVRKTVGSHERVISYYANRGELKNPIEAFLKSACGAL